MNKSLNTSSCNSSLINNKTKKRNRPFSSKLKESRKMVRLLSTGNINNSRLTSYCNLPSLNDSCTIIMRTKHNSNSISEKSKYNIEIEKLYQQNYNYKKIIKKLREEINLINKEIQKKDDILNMRNDEIESIIIENEDKNLLSNIYIPPCERPKYSLIQKMKNQLKETEQKLNETIFYNLKLKKNFKYTKFIELTIENSIFKDHINKIISLIENSEKFQNYKSKELIQYAKFNNHIEWQKKLINNLDRKYLKLEEEENILKNEIIKYEKMLNKMTNKVKIIKLKQFTLKNQNLKLKNEKKIFIAENKDDINYSLENLNKELNKAQNNYHYNKIKNKKAIEKLENIKKNFTSNLQQYKNFENKFIVLKNKENNLSMKNKNDKISKSKKNNEDYANNLKKIYQENREKENELEKGLFLFQQAIKRKINGENINLTQIRESILNSINNKQYIIDINLINNNI